MKIQRNILDTLTEVVCISLLIAVAVYLVISWSTIPEEIPLHFDSSGAVDRVGTKGELLIMPIIASVVYAMLTIVGRFPQVWNTGVKITEENRERVLRVLKNMLNVLKMMMVFTFVSLTVIMSMSTALSPWFMPVLILFIFLPIVYSMVKLYKSR